MGVDSRATCILLVLLSFFYIKFFLKFFIGDN